VFLLRYITDGAEELFNGGVFKNESLDAAADKGQKLALRLRAVVIVGRPRTARNGTGRFSPLR